MAPTTADHDSDAVSLTQQLQRKIPTLPIYLTTLWCLQCFSTSLQGWDPALPFQPKCWIVTVGSQMCARCDETKSKCEWVYRGIRGHVFELMALLEFAKQYWLNENQGYGQTDDADLVWDISMLFLNIFNPSLFWWACFLYHLGVLIIWSGNKLLFWVK